MGFKCKRPNLIKNKFISTCIGSIGFFSGLSILLEVGGFSVYITSYIHYHQDFVTMHYGYFFGLIGSFGGMLGTGLAGVLENKIGFNFTTLSGTIIMIVSNIFFFKVADIWFCYVLLFIIGFGKGMATALIGKNLMLYLPKKKGTLTSIMTIILISIMAPIALVGEKIIAKGGETLEDGQEFYSPEIADRTYLFFMLAFFTIPSGDILFLIFNYEYQEEKKIINPLKIEGNEEGDKKENKEDEKKEDEEEENKEEYKKDDKKEEAIAVNSINEYEGEEKEEKEEKDEQKNDKPDKEEEDIPEDINKLEEMQKSNSFRTKKIKAILKTWRFWRIGLGSFLSTIPSSFIGTTGRTFGALIGINGGALQFLIIAQSISVSIFGLIFGIIVDKKGPLNVFRFSILIFIPPTVLLFLFLDNTAIYLFSFVLMAIATSANSSSFSPLFMEVYGIRESVILGAVLSGAGTIANIITTILAFVLPLYYDLEELKTRYKIIYMIGTVTTVISFILFLFEKGTKFEYEVDTTELDKKLVDRDRYVTKAETNKDN